MITWDHPATAERYERFCRRHARYRRANEVLVREAAVVPGLRILDFGAGTGRTASQALRSLGPDDAIVCVEPAAAMRAAGERRLRDPRVTWRQDLPGSSERFDRVLAGAVIWQLEPLADWIRRFADLLRPGGALAFDVPAAYLGEADEPGGGCDALLLDLVAELAAERDESPSPPPEPASIRTPEEIDNLLRAATLVPRAWAFRQRVTQTAHAHWLMIPVLTERLLPGLAPAERDRRIERALAVVDARSFKWERWRGWTAWKR